jgi:SPP1 gp7 family putative phage head morphogenesis protein
VHVVLPLQPADRSTIDSLLIAAAMRADAVGHLASAEVQSWLRSVILAAADQIEAIAPGPGRAVTVDTLLRVLDDLAERLRAAKAPRSVLEAIATAHATVAKLADDSAIAALRESVPGYLPPRDLPAPDVSPLLSTFAVSDATGILDSLVGDRRDLAQYLTSQIAAATLSGIGPRELTRLIAERLTDVARYRIERAVRTELMRALAARQIAHYASTPGVERWRWNATLDSRTCGVCWTLHGQIFELTQPMIRHPNCRCVAAPVSSWALHDPEMSAELERDTGWARLAAMPEEERRRILGPGRARLLEEFRLLEKRDGWRALIQIRHAVGAPPTVGPVPLRKLEAGTWGDYRPPRNLEVATLRLIRAMEKMPGMSKRVSEYLRQYAAKRMSGSAEDLGELLERGRLLDRAMQEWSPAYRTLVERTRPVAESIMQALRKYREDRWYAIDARFALSRARDNIGLTKEELTRARADIMRFLGAIRRFQGPVFPYKNAEFQPANDRERAEGPRLMRHWRAAFAFFPRAWSERLSDIVGQLLIVDRARNSANRIGMNPAVDDERLLSTFVHELAHQHEHYNATITRWMTEFFERRRRREGVRDVYPLKDFYPGADDHEVTTLVFPNPYAGKLYRRQDREVPSEIITMAMEALLTSYEGETLSMMGDDEVRYWLLALLMEA